MRVIPDGMQVQIDAGVTAFAHIWRIERRDGVVLAFTDHDRALMFGALVCEPQSALALGAIEKSIGLSVDSASLAGAFDSAALREEDLRRGAWDGARVDIHLVNWRAPDERVHIFAGRIGEVRRGAAAFEAELRGLQAEFNKDVGRVFSRYCDADLGDARCGVDLSGSAYRGDGVVTQKLGPASFRAEGLGAFAEGWFARGRLIWDAGGEAEIVTHHLGVESVVLELRDGTVFEVGDGFTVYAGCDKRVETCRAKFANVTNFRGFPHMPGNDAVQAGPNPSETLDGGSRFQ